MCYAYSYVLTLTSAWSDKELRQKPSADHSCSSPESLTDCNRTQTSLSLKLTLISQANTRHWLWATLFYHTNVLFILQHSSCHEVATEDIQNLHNLFWPSWVQHVDLPLKNKQSVILFLKCYIYFLSNAIWYYLMEYHVSLCKLSHTMALLSTHHVGGQK